MFDYNYTNVMAHIEEMRRTILDLDPKYSTAKTFLDCLNVTERGVKELNERRNTGVRTKGKWVIEDDGNCYCSNCRVPKIQTYENFCGNCGADMGKL
jgi:hypothetical protein